MNPSKRQEERKYTSAKSASDVHHSVKIGHSDLDALYRPRS
jgi:hypothetical protein